MGNSANRDARKAERHERMAEALKLRKQRLSYEAIAKIMGCTDSTAHAYVKDAIAAIPREDAKDVLTLELLDLDRQERRADKVARDVAESAETRLKAELAILRIKERRSKYLGLDAPAKSETKTTVGFDDLSDEELERRWQEARKRDAGE